MKKNNLKNDFKNRFNNSTIEVVPEGNTVAFGVINKYNSYASNEASASVVDALLGAVDESVITSDPNVYIASKHKMYTELNNAFLPFYIVAISLGVPVGTPVSFCIELCKRGVIDINHVEFYSNGIESGLLDWQNKKGKVVDVLDMESFIKTKRKKIKGFDNSKTRRVKEAASNFYTLIKHEVNMKIREEDEKKTHEKQLEDIIMCESELDLSKQESVLNREIVNRAGKKAIHIINEYMLRMRIETMLDVVAKLKYDNDDKEARLLERKMIEEIAIIAAEKDHAK